MNRAASLSQIEYEFYCLSVQECDDVVVIIFIPPLDADWASCRKRSNRVVQLPRFKKVRRVRHQLG